MTADKQTSITPTDTEGYLPLCGYCSEKIVFEFIRRPPSGFRKLAPLEIEMLVQEMPDITVIEDLAANNLHAVSTACRKAEAAVQRGGGNDGDCIALHHVRDGWCSPSNKRRPEPHEAAGLLKRFAEWWPTERDYNQRMALAGIVMPEAFAAMAVLRLYGSSKQIEVGLLPVLRMTQGFSPSPEGYELWLQRRSILAVFDAVGIDAILDNYASPIRPALFLYLTLKRSLSGDDRRRLMVMAEDDGEECSLELIVELAGKEQKH